MTRRSQLTTDRLTLLLATTNPDKLREIRAALRGAKVRLMDLADLPPAPAPEETGETFAANARLKALHYDRVSAAVSWSDDVLTVAEDSGLVVDALGGEPGVRSARFVRPDASYAERFAEIYRRLAASPDSNRQARFVCAVAVARRGEVVFEATGVVDGEIARTPQGTHGFGYDPIFFYPPDGRTLAEVSDEAKRRVAHRGKAFARLAGWLRNRA
jgi:XTP/dITP diphosphohydrolase